MRVTKDNLKNGTVYIHDCRSAAECRGCKLKYLEHSCFEVVQKPFTKFDADCPPIAGCPPIGEICHNVSTGCGWTLAKEEVTGILTIGDI